MKLHLTLLLLVLFANQLLSQEKKDGKKDEKIYSYQMNGDVLLHNFDLRNNKVIEKNWLADKFQFSDRAKITIAKGDDKGEYQILKLLKFKSKYELIYKDVDQEKVKKLISDKEKSVIKKISAYKDTVQNLFSVIPIPEQTQESDIRNYATLKQKIEAEYKSKIDSETKALKKYTDSLKALPLRKPCLIQIKNRKGEFKPYPFEKKYINIDDQEKHFAIETSKFNALIENGYIRKRFRQNYHFAYGASLTVPFKIRPEVNELNMKITPELSLGGFVGGKWRINRYKDNFIYLPILTVGVSTININSDTTNADAEGDDGLVLARTISAGVVFEFDKFQIGCILGWDKPGGEIAKDWVYNDRLWYSVSIGFDFLSKSVVDKSKETTQKN